MCFSLEMSTFMLILGSFTTVVAYKKINKNVALMFGFFTIMQAIHVVGYLTLNDCDNIYNKMASYSNYSHICFQPLFNLIGFLGLMQFTGYIDNSSRSRMNYALYLALAIGIFLFIRMFNISTGLRSHKTKTKKSLSCMWCGETCSFKGEKHINFSLPLLYPSYVTPSLFLHLFGMFILPLFINKFTALLAIILAITTYVPAYIHDIPGSEAGTIWCFTSIVQSILLLLFALFYKK